MTLFSRCAGLRGALCAHAMQSNAHAYAQARSARNAKLRLISKGNRSPSGLPEIVRQIIASFLQRLLDGDHKMLVTSATNLFPLLGGDRAHGRASETRGEQTSTLGGPPRWRWPRMRDRVCLSGQNWIGPRSFGEASDTLFLAGKRLPSSDSVRLTVPRLGSDPSRNFAPRSVARIFSRPFHFIRMPDEDHVAVPAPPACSALSRFPSHHCHHDHAVVALAVV